MIRAEDHPHACGDKSFADVSRSPRKGSSPRVWGQACPKKLAEILTRIIPTRVGTRGCGSGSKGSYKDHPHACGDKDVMIINELSGLGSSPRVWGQASDGVSFDNCDRIIPTRVGTSLCDRETQLYPWDHPHACGDKAFFQILRQVLLGSSPRVWGQDCNDSRHNADIRIIPTRVGTSKDPLNGYDPK